MMEQMVADVMGKNPKRRTPFLGAFARPSDEVLVVKRTIGSTYDYMTRLYLEDVFTRFHDMLSPDE